MRKIHDRAVDRRRRCSRPPRRRSRRPLRPRPRAAPAPMPDQMPFDIAVRRVNHGRQGRQGGGGDDRRGDEIAAQLEARHRGGRYQRRPGPLSSKMDQTQVGSIDIAIGKARTAARFRRASEVFAGADGRRRPGFGLTTLDPALDRLDRRLSRWSRAARSSARSAAAARPARRTAWPARPAPRRSSRSALALSSQGASGRRPRSRGRQRRAVSPGRSRSAASSCARSG